MVPQVGLEPTRLSTIDFESIASTISPLGQRPVDTTRRANRATTLYQLLPDVERPPMFAGASLRLVGRLVIVLKIQQSLLAEALQRSLVDVGHKRVEPAGIMVLNHSHACAAVLGDIPHARTVEQAVADVGVAQAH